MLDAHSRDVLQEVVRREGRSLLQYVAEAFPWTPTEDEAEIERLKQMAGEQSEAIARLMRFLQRQHAPVPYLGAFPTSFTSVNFVTLAYLRPILLKHAEHEIPLLERDLAQVADTVARALLTDLLALKKRHRDELANANKLEAHASGER
jgi:hypothetical protein